MSRVLLALVLASSPAWAQPAAQPLFAAPPAGATAAALLEPGASMRAAVAGQQVVSIRFERLFDGVRPLATVTLNVGGRVWNATLNHVASDRAGFRSWVGTLDGVEFSHVVFTERNGIVSGLIDAVDDVYRVATARQGVYLLERVARDELGLELDPLAGASAAPVSEPAGDSLAADDVSVVDVLLLYTPQARFVSGGINQIEALAAQTISDGNTIFARSGVRTRLRLAASREFVLIEDRSMVNDLRAVTNSPVANALRELYGADVVQLLVSSPDLSACGVAWVLSDLTSDFTPFSVADIACAAQYTPTHEIGHNFGAHHAPEDGASGGLFPYSYGFKDPENRFRTVMAYACPGGCPRIANFSNPTRWLSTPPTGLQSTVGGNAVTLFWNRGVDLVTGALRQNNTLTLNQTAPTVAGFRSPPGGLPTTVLAAPLESAPSFWLMVGTTPASANVFNASVGDVTTVSGVLPAGRYFWRVMANNTAGSTPSSPEAAFAVGAICTPPAAPRNFNFSVSSRIVTLEWTAPAAGDMPTSYIVETGSAPGASDLFAGSLGSPATVAVTPAPPGTYFVRIRAQNACGVSGPSNERVIVVP